MKRKLSTAFEGTYKLKIDCSKYEECGTTKCFMEKLAKSYYKKFLTTSRRPDQFRGIFSDEIILHYFLRISYNIIKFYFSLCALKRLQIRSLIYDLSKVGKRKFRIGYLSKISSLILNSYHLFEYAWDVYIICI